MILPILIALCLSTGVSCLAVENPTTHRILYLANQGAVADAFALYTEYTEKIGCQDHELLQQIGLNLLAMGFASKEPELQLLAVFGAGVAAHDQATQLLSQGVSNPLPQIQIASLNLLAQLGNDEADAIINRTAASGELLIRLYALYHLAEKQHPAALGQIEALYHKVDPRLRPLFPQFFALCSEPRATLQLRRLLHDAEENVRLQALLSIGKQQRDDLLPQVRACLSHVNAREQEACSAIVAAFGDQTSLPRLKTLATSKVSDVSLAACAALYELGLCEYQNTLFDWAQKGDLFAIRLLGKVEGSEALLFSLMRAQNVHVRANAALSLLERRDPRCLLGLSDILICDGRDLAFAAIQSRGQTLTAWKALSCSHPLFQANPAGKELSTHMREETLTACLDLPEETFLEIADLVFTKQQNDLIPTLIPLLETLGSSGAIALLKKYEEKAGAPLIRNYCNLALFKMGEKGLYREKLKKWLLAQQSLEMIQFRPTAPLDFLEQSVHDQLTPAEASRLFIASIEALVAQHDPEGLNILLELIAHGNPKNRSVLAGVLVRAAQ